MIQKIIKVKNKIEHEINNINKLYEKTIDDLTKSFQRKHEELIKEENNLKEELQNKVTKVKEQLENFYSEINNKIKINEILGLGINKLNNEEQNINKTLSYVSKINKNKKNIHNSLIKNMKNLKINFQEEQNNIKYEEYIFNGIDVIGIPKDIKIKNVSGYSLDLFWDVDHINSIIIDYDKINFIVEMKKEKEDFKEVYKGKDLCCSIHNLEMNIDYELRICSFYNDIIGQWSPIQNFKTMEYDSIILYEQNERINELNAELLEWTGYEKMELIYRGTRDGMTSNKFHEKCDNQGPTITLIKTDKNIFGGYTSISWSSDGNIILLLIVLYLH